MESDTISQAAAADRLADMVGEHVWAPRIGQDAVLRLDVGDPHLIIHQPSTATTGASGAVRAALRRRVVVPTGRWHLFIESGLWRVEAGDRSCNRRDAESDDPARMTLVDKCLSFLDGQRLTHVVGSASQWRFDFDLGGSLSINAAPRDGNTMMDANWTLFLEGGGHLSWMLDGGYLFEKDPATGA